MEEQYRMLSTKISFLVTYYNQEKYVDDSLQSIFELNIPCEYEVLVGDDGSTDGTVDRVKEWQKKFGDRLQVFRMDRDADKERDSVIRVSNLRRFLLKKSTGNYFCVLDGDDYYCDKDFVADALQIYKDNANLSVVMFNYQMVYTDRTETAKPLPIDGQIDNREFIRGYYKPAGSCVLKKFSEDIFFSRISKALYYDDADILIYNLSFGELWNINRVVYSYRQHGDSIWNSMNRAQKGILNMLGADNEAFLAPIFSDDIYYKYGTDILYAYFRRFNPEKRIGKEFYKKYLNLCKTDFLSKTLLAYQESTEKERAKLEEVIMMLKEQDPNLYSRIEQEKSVAE